MNDNQFIPFSELIINPDGSIYHLLLKPGEVATNIITVGDQDRVESITKHFDSIEFTRQNREFKTSTGSMRGKRITVISTGIGTDNIDIVLNELDALFQFDFESRTRKNIFTKLNFVRIGTSGALQTDIPIDSFLVSAKALSFDRLFGFYDEQNFDSPKNWPSRLDHIRPYITHASFNLLNRVPADFMRGITATMPGFYAPQGRSFRLRSVFDAGMHDLQSTVIDGLRVTNLEMETAGIYGLAQLLGHNAISFNALLANRINGDFSKNPAETIEILIEKVLQWMLAAL